jgi:hypothetical protein
MRRFLFIALSIIAVSAFAAIGPAFYRFSQPIMLPNGTASAPSLEFADTGNFGIFGVTGSRIGFAVDNAELLGIWSGNIITFNGGVVQWTGIASGSVPACNASRRGTVILVAGGAGVADAFQVCSKDAADAYAYRALY